MIRTVAYRSISWGQCVITLEEDGRRVTAAGGSRGEARALAEAELAKPVVPVAAAVVERLPSRARRHNLHGAKTPKRWAA